MGVVVDHGQQADTEEHEHDDDQLECGVHGVLEDVPVLDDLHDETGQQAELTARRAGLYTGRDEGEVSGGHTLLYTVWLDHRAMTLNNPNSTVESGQDQYVYVS